MLKFAYSQNGQNFQWAEYAKASDFVAAQFKEVPDLQDYLKVKEITVDGVAVDLPDATVGGLFNYLNA